MCIYIYIYIYYINLRSSPTKRPSSGARRSNNTSTASKRRSQRESGFVSFLKNVEKGKNSLEGKIAEGRFAEGAK